MMISAFEDKKTCICKALKEFEVLFSIDGIADTSGKYSGIDLYFNSSLDRYLLFVLKDINVKYPEKLGYMAACNNNCAPDSFIANCEIYAFVARASVDSALNCLINTLAHCCIKFGRITADTYSVVDKILKSKIGIDIFSKDKDNFVQKAKGLLDKNYVLIHIDGVELYLNPQGMNENCECVICDC